jgi:hypothetical protein
MITFSQASRFPLRITNVLRQDTAIDFAASVERWACARRGLRGNGRVRRGARRFGLDQPIVTPRRSIGQHA